jgi:dTDP-4-amino-4,6-dideoxygalactose transaminase
MNIQVTRSSMPPFEEYVQLIRPLWDSRWLTNFGALHERFEQELQDYLGVEGVSLFANGHLALEGIFETLGLQGEVITTPFTFASTTHALVRQGLRPVFADIKADDFTLDLAKIEGLITEKTCAIVPVHVYGNICDTEGIEALAAQHGLKVIYDAAHAFGETIDGVSVARLGDASLFSFHATKVFNSIEGGLITTEDPALLPALRLYKNFGIKNAEEVEYAGTNAKMNEFAAAMGLCNLRYLEREIAARAAVCACYREQLEGVAGIQMNVVQPGVASNYAYFPIIVHEEAYGRTRDELAEHLAEHGVIVRKYFYPLTSDFACYAKLDAGHTPVARSIASRVMTLPIYADLSLEDVERISGIIRSFGRS